MPDVHSNLPPSASKMWISCPPSAALNAKAPDSDSSYALAGTLAHSIGEAKIRQALGEDISIPECTDAEMAEATDQYRDYVLEQIEAAVLHAAILLSLLNSVYPVNAGRKDASVLPTFC